MSGGVLKESGAYRRGVVLGLTMAEIMLLIVFVLLIVFAATSRKSEDERKDLESQVRQANFERDAMAASNARALGLETPRPAGSTGPAGASGSATGIPSDWRDVVAAKATLDQLSSSGFSVSNIENNLPLLRAADALRADGASQEEVLAALPLAREMRDLIASGMTPSQIRQAAERDLDGRSSEGSGGAGEHDWPPIINLSEANGYSFSIGRSELTADFENSLRTSVIDRLLEIVSAYDVDVVEVIGHTDERPMGARTSNLDQNLRDILEGRKGASDAMPADNSGLGMARAVSVASTLGRDPRLSDVRIIPLSAAQLVAPGDRIARGSDATDASRRRIEIRVRRSAN